MYSMFHVYVQCHVLFVHVHVACVKCTCNVLDLDTWDLCGES